MPRISEPTLAAALRRRFEITGEGVIDTLSPELVAVVVAEDLTTREPVRRAVQGQNLGASGAGNQRQLELINPPGSGVLAQVERIDLTTEAIDRVQIISVTTAAGGVASRWRDNRLAGAPACTVLATTPAAIVFGINQPTWRTLADENVTIDLDWWLPPGFRLFILQENQNDYMLATLFWNERDLLQSEQ